MADSVDASFCGAICAGITGALEAWCNLKAFGGGTDTCCGGQRGCCGSCFDKGFDDDAFDKEDRKAEAKAKAKAAANRDADCPPGNDLTANEDEPVDVQPAPSKDMINNQET